MASRPEDDRPDAMQRDADVVLHIRTGALTEAFDLIMQRYESKVYRLCLSFMRDRTQAEDAAQESLVRLWRALPRYDSRAALSTWIYAITRNWCLTCLSSKRGTLSLSETSVQTEVETLTAADVQEAVDQRQTIQQMVNELPEATRRIVTLFYFEEQSVASVSELLALAPGTVKTHLFRARAVLLARLKSLGLAEPAMWAGAVDRAGGFDDR